MTITENTTTATTFAIEHEFAILNNVAACGGDWLYSGMVQTARNNDLDVVEFVAAVVKVANLKGREDLAAKLEAIDF